MPTPGHPERRVHVELSGGLSGYLPESAVKVCDNGHVVEKSIYLVLAITLEGKNELLRLWIDQSEGAKFWRGTISELKNRGVQDILIAAGVWFV